MTNGLAAVREVSFTDAEHSHRNVDILARIEEELEKKRPSLYQQTRDEESLTRAIDTVVNASQTIKSLIKLKCEFEKDARKSAEQLTVLEGLNLEANAEIASLRRRQEDLLWEHRSVVERLTEDRNGLAKRLAETERALSEATRYLEELSTSIHKHLQPALRRMEADMAEAGIRT